MNTPLEIDFKVLRRKIFHGNIKQSQVDGIKVILDACAEYGVTDASHVGNILGQAYHETAHTFKPVMEAMSRSSHPNPKESARRLQKAWKAGKLNVKKPYWRRDRQGRRWMGRGYVQITLKPNYVKFQRAIKNRFGVDIVKNPDDVMRQDVAAYILVVGMRDGSFTGRKLSSAGSGLNFSHYKARSIVNPGERRAWKTRVARGCKIFASALINGDILEVQQMLSKKGYHVGKLDGLYGPLTKAAVLSFKDANGLPTTAALTRDFRAALTTGKSRDIRPESVEGLRASGSRTIKAADSTTVAGVATAALGTVGVVADKLKDVEVGVSGVTNSLTSVSAMINDNLIFAVLGLAAFVAYQAYVVRKLRVEDHITAKHIGR